MGVFLVLTLFICIKQNIAVTNQVLSPLPADSLQRPLIDPISPTLKYSAKQYILPTVSNVLYSISPRAIPSRSPPVPPVININSPSNVPIYNSNGPVIVSPKYLTAPTIPEERKNLRQIPQAVRDPVSGVKDTTRYFLLPSDNTLYPLCKKNDRNTIYPDTKWSPLPNDTLCDLSTYMLPYLTKSANQIEKLHPQNVPNIKTIPKETVPVIIRKQDDVHTRQDAKYLACQKSKDIIDQIIGDPNTLQTTQNVLQNPMILPNNNDVDKICLNDSRYYHNTDAFAFKSAMAPVAHNENIQTAPKLSIPAYPFMVMENKKRQSDDINKFENARKVEGSHRPEMQVDRHSLDKTIYNNYTTVPRSENQCKFMKDQPIFYFSHPRSSTMPPTEKIKIDLQNTEKDTTTNYYTNFLDGSGLSKGKEFYVNLQDILKSPNNMGPNLVKARNNNCLRQSFPIILEQISQYNKYIDHVKNFIDLAKLPTNDSQVQGPKSENSLSEGTKFQCPQNKELLSSKKIEENKQTNFEESKMIFNSTNQNNLVEKYKPKNHLNKVYVDSQNQIETNTQQYILAHTPFLDTFKTKLNNNTIINQNNYNQPKKAVNTSQSSKSNVLNEISAQNDYHNVDDTKEATMPVQRFPFNTLALDNQPNYLPNHTPQPTKELRNDMDYNKVWGKKSEEHTTTRDNSNAPKIHNSEYNIKTDKFLIQDPLSFYNKGKQINPDQYTQITELQNGCDIVQGVSQNFNTHLNSVYSQNPLHDMQESFLKSSIPSNQNLNYIQNQIKDETSLQKQLALEKIPSNYDNSLNNIKSIPDEFNSRIDINGIKINTVDYKLGNNDFPPGVSFTTPLPIIPTNPHKIYMHTDKSENIVKGNQWNTPTPAVLENASNNKKENVVHNLYHDPNSSYVQITTTQSSDNYYTPQGTSDHNNVEIPLNISPINILPTPIEPAVIQKPGTYTVSAKTMYEQPRVYTKVQNSAYTDPQFTVSNQDYKTADRSRVQITDENYHNPAIINKSAGAKHFNGNPTFETIVNNNSFHEPNPIARYSSLPQKSVSSTDPSVHPLLSNDIFTSLVSSSLNNIASVLITNLISTLKANVPKNTDYGISANFVPTKMSTPNINLPPGSPHASLGVPIFLVTPPCIESPRKLPNPVTSELPEDNLSKNLHGTKTNATTAAKNKKSDSKSFIPSITINVLPSVQQTSNDIIILV